MAFWRLCEESSANFGYNVAFSNKFLKNIFNANYNWPT